MAIDNPETTEARLWIADFGLRGTWMEDGKWEMALSISDRGFRIAVSVCTKMFVCPEGGQDTVTRGNALG